jgi:hypothetical protein
LRLENAGIVHQADKLAESVVAGFEQAYDIGFDRDIGGDCDCLRTGGFHLSDKSFGLFACGLVVDADGIPALRCEAGGCRTNASAGACDD